MKTIKFLFAAILMMMATCTQAQTIQIMKNGQVIKEYLASEVDSVVYKPAQKVDRNIYQDENASIILFENKIQPAGTIKVGDPWDTSKSFTVPVNQRFISTNTKFKMYNKSLADTIEVYCDCKQDLAPIYYLTDVAGGEFIIEEIK